MNAHSSETALIPGASSGIGAAFARKLASQGYALVLVARREERLASLAAELQAQFHVDVEVLAADLSYPAGIERVEKRMAELEALDILVNNAGFGDPGRFAEIPLERHVAMIQVHVLASVRLSRTVLPGMIARGRGAIINVSSIDAFGAKPDDVTYCATKAYINVFSEGLQAELLNTGVHVQALCPGFTYTEFHDRPAYESYPVKAKIPKALWMSPEVVVAESLVALERGRVICIPGFKNRLLVALLVSLARSRLAPLLVRAMDARLRKPVTHG